MRGNDCRESTRWRGYRRADYIRNSPGLGKSCRSCHWSQTSGLPRSMPSRRSISVSPPHFPEHQDECSAAGHVLKWTRRCSIQDPRTFMEPLLRFNGDEYISPSTPIRVRIRARGRADAKQPPRESVLVEPPWQMAKSCLGFRLSWYSYTAYRRWSA
jgi:hypothetical protein